MDRCTSCIRMLQMLKSRGFMSRNEIADELQCNKRNIIEYRKVLEDAGYIIQSTRGMNGGYALLQDCLLPSLSFTKQEKRAIQEMRDYLNSHQDFLMKQEMNAVFDKILSNVEHPSISNSVYLYNEQYILSEKIREMIQTMEQAIQERCAVELVYRTMKDRKFQKVDIHPYEIINYKGAYYCIAYSLKAKDYRIYKFSEERMKQITLMDIRFLRDKEFDIKQHIGKSGLVKQEIMVVEMEVYDEAAIFCAEKQIGIQPYHTWKDERTLYYRTIFEGKQAAISFILSLGDKVMVTSPKELLQEIKQQILGIEKRYSS